MGAGIWCSPGMSSTYLVTTDDGRIVVNTGMWFEARTHKRNYDAVTDRADALHHPDPEPHRPHRRRRHVPRGRHRSSSRRPTSPSCQADDERIHGLRIRRSLPFFADVMGQSGLRPRRRRDDPAAARSRRTPTSRSTTRYALDVRRPAHRAASACPAARRSTRSWCGSPTTASRSSGNMFSALFGHFPNLVTMRGDRMRSAPAFVDVGAARDRPRAASCCCSAITDRCAARPPIRVGVRADPRRGAVRARRDRRGDERRARRVDRDARDPRCPSTSISARRTAASTGAFARSGRRTRAGSTSTRRSTSTARRPEHGRARDRRPRGRAPTPSRRAPRRSRPTDPLTAVRLCELALAVDAEHRGALDAYRARPRAAARRPRPRELLAHALARRRSAQRDEPARAARRAVTEHDPHRRPRASRASTPRSAPRSTTSRPSTSASTPTRCSPRRRDRARCDDFGDPAFRTRLDAMIAAVEADTGLGPLGRLAIHQRTTPAPHVAAARGGPRAPPPRDPRHRAPGADRRDRAAPLGHHAPREPHRGRHPAALAARTGRASSRARARRRPDRDGVDPR